MRYLDIDIHTVTHNNNHYAHDTTRMHTDRKLPILNSLITLVSNPFNYLKLIGIPIVHSSINTSIYLKK